MSIVHQTLAQGQWFTLTIAEQLGNIGSEVGRSLSYKKTDNTERFEPAFSRALELFDLTLSDARWNFPRRKEIARAREVFCELCQSLDWESTAADSLNKYFLQFGILARNNH